MMKEKIKMNWQEKPNKDMESAEDLEINPYVDVYGVRYSPDRKRLLMAPKAITEYTVLEGTEIICNRAFEECDSLQRIIVPKGVKTIGSEAFGVCSSLESITLPKSLTQIKEWAFSGCVSLKTITIPSCVSLIERGAFEGCHCEIISESTHYKGGFDLYSVQEKKLVYCSTSIVKYIMPEDVSVIGEYAFFDCTMLKSIDIPDSVLEIEDGAFCGCDSLFNIKLPNSLMSIGEHAFSGCESIKAIYIPESVVKIGNTAFEDCNSLKRIYVPASTKARFEKLLPGCESRIIESDDTNSSINYAGYDNEDEEGLSLKGGRFGHKGGKLKECL